MNISEITYQGNKTRFMKVLKPLIEANLDADMVYIEPFGGGMNSFTPINSTKKIANDVNEYNIALWNELKSKGFDGIEKEWSKYFDILSNCEDKPNGENYLKARLLYLDMKLDCLSNGGKYPKALLGFVAYSCSFGGSWWNGFVGFNPRRGENYIKEAIGALKRQVSNTINLDKSEFLHGNYNAIDIPDNAFIYCDPPYSGTKQYATDFDSETFWEWCRNIINEKENVKILVSEYLAPSDFVCIWSQVTQDKMGSKQQNKVEKLFIHNSQVSQFNLTTLNNNLSYNRLEEMKIKLTNSELTAIISESVKRIMENMQDELMAYHGSEAEFDKFDLGFIGTGEGTQVYGYGLYFTDVYDTGKWYAISNVFKNHKNNKTLPRSESKTIITYMDSILQNIKGWDKGVMEKDIEDFRRRVRLNFEKMPTKNSKSIAARDALLKANTFQDIQDYKTELMQNATTGFKRRVYSVEIPDDNYIDWTNDDPGFIMDMYKKFSTKFDLSHVDIKKVKSFGDLFEKIRGWHSLTDLKSNGEIIPQKVISEFLYNMGWNGIKVRTGHRNGGDGRGHNFVVFNDKDVKITDVAEL